MDRAINLSKKAFIAMLNDRARRRVVVDTFYKVIDGKQRLVIQYSDGSQEVFKGLRAA